MIQTEFTMISINTYVGYLYVVTSNCVVDLGFFWQRTAYYASTVRK